MAKFKIFFAAAFFASLSGKAQSQEKVFRIGHMRDHAKVENSRTFVSKSTFIGRPSHEFDDKYIVIEGKGAELIIDTLMQHVEPYTHTKDKTYVTQFGIHCFSFRKPDKQFDRCSIRISSLGNFDGFMGDPAVKSGVHDGQAQVFNDEINQILQIQVSGETAVYIDKNLEKRDGNLRCNIKTHTCNFAINYIGDPVSQVSR